MIYFYIRFSHITIYMALFIAAENQNILWEMINKVPLCNVVFPPGSQNNKNNWFKNIIQEYYNRAPPNITRNDLYKINRDVLSYMVKQLGELERSSINPSSINKSIDTRDVPTKTNMSEFEIRQSQYKNMFEVQKPQTIDFSEKIDDDVITNMNELIENHKKMREQDLQELLPMQTMQIEEQKKEKQNIRVNITNDVPKDAIQSIIIDDVKDEKEKHVRFAVPEKNDNNYKILETKLDILVDKFENMESKIGGLYNILDNIYKMLDVKEAKVEAKVEEKISDNVDAIKRMM